MATSAVTPAGEWQDLLRGARLRATPGRLATLAHLEAHPHSSVAEIGAGLADRFPTLSAQSIHNITNDLAAGGLIRRIDLPGSGSARYETRVHDNHHHVQCVVCGRIEDVDCAVGHAPCLTPSETHGMRILEAQVTFRAVCPGCEAALAAPAPPDRTTPTIPTPTGKADNDV